MGVTAIFNRPSHQRQGNSDHGPQPGETQAGITKQGLLQQGGDLREFGAHDGGEPSGEMRILTGHRYQRARLQQHARAARILDQGGEARRGKRSLLI